MVLGGVCQTPTYLSGQGKEAVQAEFRKQVEVFVANKVDFLLAEVRFIFIFWYCILNTVVSIIERPVQEWFLKLFLVMFQNNGKFSSLFFTASTVSQDYAWVTRSSPI